jgi:glycosyltransferase involved in cell wall biosynthesis
MEDKEPLVSICCITYNHENYIRDAIEGFLIQNTSFPFEIIIHDDASTDNTANIIEEYANKYPDLFVTILQSENQWSKGGGSIYARFVYPRARGKYIALCEGDDYWTDPLKLQKQVDFLEENPDYGIVHTNFSTSDGKRISINYYPRNDQYLNSFLSGNISIGTLTVLFRRNLYDTLPKYYHEKNFKMGDLPLWIEFAKNSKIKYIPDSTAMYRVLDNSASHSSDIDKEIDFRKSSLKVKLFYIEKFRLFELKKQALMSFYSGIIKLSYEKHNRQYSEKYFKKLCKIGRPSFRTILFFYGSKYRIIRHFINYAYKLLN